MTSRPTPHQRPLSVEHLFQHVPDAIQNRLTGPAANHIALPRDGRLFEQGDAGGSMYVVKEGRVEISLVSETGKRVVFNQIGPGECFGEISMLDQGPRTASAVAIEDSKLLVIKRTEFLDAVQTCPNLAINLLHIMSERVRWTSSAVEEYSVHPLELRVARRLLMLHQNFASADGFVEISQSDLADFAGSTREATNKILMEWKASGVIRLERRKISLVRRDVLSRIAHANSDI